MKSVKEFMELLVHPQLDLIQTIREEIKSVDVCIQERIKWNAPSYHINNIDFLTFGPMNRPHILLVFHHPSIVEFQTEFLEGNYKDRRLMTIKSEEEFDLKKETLTKIIAFTIDRVGS